MKMVLYLAYRLRKKNNGRGRGLSIKKIFPPCFFIYVHVKDLLTKSRPIKWKIKDRIKLSLVVKEIKTKLKETDLSQ